MIGLERESKTPQEAASATAIVAGLPGSPAARQPVRPVFYDETQRRRVWFYGMSTLFSTVACFLLTGFIVSVRTPPAFAAAEMLPMLGALAQRSGTDVGPAAQQLARAWRVAQLQSRVKQAMQSRPAEAMQVAPPEGLSALLVGR
jgi:hypothetical protein